MYTLDANIFLRDLDPREPDHAVCRDLLAALRAATFPIVVPTLLITEVAGTLSRVYRDPMRARLTIETIQQIPQLTLVTLEDALIAEATLLAADCMLRGADAIYVAVAQRYHCTLVSLDREQRERALLRVPAMTPAEALVALR